MLSGNYSNFQIPNNPGQPTAFSGERPIRTLTPPTSMRTRQRTLLTEFSLTRRNPTYFNMQASVFTRYSVVLFRPDEVGDLFFNGVASRVDRQIYTNGLEVDMSYKLNDQNTLRGGLLFTASHATVDTVTLVFPVDAMGNQTSDAPLQSSIIPP